MMCGTPATCLIWYDYTTFHVFLICDDLNIFNDDIKCY